MAKTTSQAARSVLDRLAEVTSRAIHVFDTQPEDSEASLRRLLKNLPGMAYRCRTDPKRTMEFVSAGSRDVTGFDPSDLVDGQVVSYATLIHEDDRGRVQEAVRTAVATRQRFQVTYRMRRADGGERWVWEQGRVSVGDPGEPGRIEGFIVDVTEQGEVDRERHELEKREALAQMATDIAHDLNNFLGVIRTTAEVLAAERSHDTALTKDLRDIIDAVTRGSTVGGQLLAFGRLGRDANGTTSVAGVTRALVPMLTRLPGVASLDLAIEPGLLSLRVSPHRFEELMTRLVLSAGRAMVGGGPIHIGARASTDGTGAIVEVRAEGAGMDDGGATSGLEHVRRLVVEAGGSIEMDSEVGTGWTYRLAFPFADAESR
jgi:PAS domain S-box-containing protein